MRSLAALGFRVKSGWAAAVLLTGSARSPQLCGLERIDLSNPRLPETRQPYHAAMGRLETDAKKISRRVDVVRRITKKSIAKLLSAYRQQNFTIKHAALVVGSQIDPRSIANAHIRAHALEGQLFRSVLQQSLHEHGIRAEVLLEREAYGKAAVELKQSKENVRRMIQNFGRDTKGSWRTEQKLAAVAAWVALD
ncbi:MAG: hypothetical protein WAN04_00865 [Candidatus Udaeobacter sp.]